MSDDHHVPSLQAEDERLKNRNAISHHVRWLLEWYLQQAIFTAP